MKQVDWCCINSADSLVILTNDAIKAFEIELNNFSKVIEIASYDKKINNFSLLRKSQSEDHYVICLGVENVIVCDMGLSKIERVQCEASSDDEMLDN